MFPFSVAHKPKLKTHRVATTPVYKDSGYELISFDAEKLNVFTAQIDYCEPHWHSAPELICILSGEFSITLGNSTLVVMAGCLLYINPDEIHSLEARAANSQLLTIQFSPHLFDEIHPVPIMEYVLMVEQPHRQIDLQVRHTLSELITHLIEQPSSFKRIALIYQLLEALDEVGKANNLRPSYSARKKDQQLIKYGIEFINQHFAEELSLATVADSAGVSYYHFSRLFKKISGYNFKEYLTMIRINQAKLLLKDTRIPITEISYTCGFSCHKQIIFAFNKYCRMTPTEFRKNYITAINLSEQEPIITNFHCLSLEHYIVEILQHFTSSICVQ